MSISWARLYTALYTTCFHRPRAAQKMSSAAAEVEVLPSAVHELEQDVASRESVRWSFMPNCLVDPWQVARVLLKPVRPDRRDNPFRQS